MPDKVSICTICGKEYNVKETRRVFGDHWWSNTMCSPNCYTQNMTKREEKEKISKDNVYKKFIEAGATKKAAKLCVDFAWDLGHSNGQFEVNNYMWDLIEIIKAQNKGGE